MGYLSHKMDKYDKYNPDEETIEAWLKGFEIRLLCNNIAGAEHKRNWCTVGLWWVKLETAL